MKPSKHKNTWVVTACLIFWGLSLLMLVSPSIIDSNSLIFGMLPLVITIAGILTVVAAIMLAIGLTNRNPKQENFAYSPVAKLLASLVILSLLISTGTAVRSLWFSPLAPDYADRFVYENIATAVGFLGIVLTLYLSAVQKDIFWISRRKQQGLDERQLQERRQVFEKSYKLSVLLVVVVGWWVLGSSHNIPAVIANNYGSLPGHVGWIGVNLVVALLALPLVVAAWMRPHKTPALK